MHISTNETHFLWQGVDKIARLSSGCGLLLSQLKLLTAVADFLADVYSRKGRRSQCDDKKFSFYTYIFF